MKLREIVADACKRKPQGHALGMNRLFQISSVAGLISVFFIHVMCCLLPIIFKTVYGQGNTFEQAAEITNQVGMSIVIIYLIVTRRFALPKWMVCFQPLGGLILCEIMKCIPVVWRNDISVAFESMENMD